MYEAVTAKQRVADAIVKREGMRVEENIAQSELQKQVDAGQISQDHAQRLLTRAKMHHQIDSTQSARLDDTVAAGVDFVTTEAMLEDVLDGDSKIYAVRVFKFVFGIYRLEAMISSERRRRKSPGFQHPYPRVNRIVETIQFEIFIGVVMAINGLVIGIQTSANAGEDLLLDMLLDLLEHCFTFTFVVEITMRFMSSGWIWIWSTANFCDAMVLLCTGIIPVWILSPAGVESSGVRTAQVLRVLRLVRVIRLVRQLPFFRILWELIQGVLDCGRILLWTYVVVGSLLYVFAIFGTYLMSRNPTYEGDPIAEKYFGDIGAAMVTCFQTLTLDSWHSIARPLMAKSWVACFFFVLLIMVTTLCLLNLITAVIVNNAFSRKMQDVELQAAIMKEQAIKEIEDLKEIFAEIDEDGSGSLSHEEYEQAVKHNERVGMKLQLLDVQPNEWDEIWTILDDGGNDVTVEQFCSVLRALQGEARAKDSFSVVQRVRRLELRIRMLRERTHRLRTYNVSIKGKVHLIRQDVFALLQEVRGFLENVGTCIPATAVTAATERMLDERRGALMDRYEKTLVAAPPDTSQKKRTSQMAARAFPTSSNFD